MGIGWSHPGGKAAGA